MLTSIEEKLQDLSVAGKVEALLGSAWSRFTRKLQKRQRARGESRHRSKCHISHRVEYKRASLLSS